MDTKDLKNKNVVVAADDTHSSEKQDGIKNVVVAYDETRNNENVADKVAGIKSAIVASDDTRNNQQNDEKEAGIKNVVAASDDSHKNEQNAENEAGIKNVDVASKEKCIDKDDDEDEKETGTDLGISLEKLSLGPKKKLLVLPLGGFVVHRAHRRRPKTIPKKSRPDFLSGNFMIYKRPYCEDFLKFCFERFEVGIWSSAMEHNIDGVLFNIMREHRSKLLFTWDQDQCTETGFMCVENKYKPLFLKELKYVWQQKWRDVEYSSSNTLLVTDPVKALLNHAYTSIFPGDYDPDNKEDDFLGPDGELRAFLNGLAEANDVPTYVKAHPFGEAAITPSHSDWNYYSKIIRSLSKE